jgi:hypothetical protein
MSLTSSAGMGCVAGRHAGHCNASATERLPSFTVTVRRGSCCGNAGLSKNI